MYQIMEYDLALKGRESCDMLQHGWALKTLSESSKPGQIL